MVRTCGSTAPLANMRFISRSAKSRGRKRPGGRRGVGSTLKPPVGVSAIDAEASFKERSEDRDGPLRLLVRRTAAMRPDLSRPVSPELSRRRVHPPRSDAHRRQTVRGKTISKLSRCPDIADLPEPGARSNQSSTRVPQPFASHSKDFEGVQNRRLRLTGDVWFRERTTSHSTFRMGRELKGSSLASVGWKRTTGFRLGPLWSVPRRTGQRATAFAFRRRMSAGSAGAHGEPARKQLLLT